MSKKKLYRPIIEALESRIAPAAVAAPLPTIKDAELAWDKNQFTDRHFVTAVTNTPLLLTAGQVLTTGAGARSGQYLMFVQKGTAEVFTTDLNNNGQVDYNEITGIAAGDGLRLISFVDIHGDIVTNLDSDTTLSDSDNNASNNPVTHGDGRVLNNSRIDSITMRSLVPADLTTTDGAPGTAAEVSLRIAFTSYSIFGEILAGKGLGVEGDPTSGLHIDTTGVALQKVLFGDTGTGPNYYVATKPTVGAIHTGTAASGEYFSFGYSHNDDVQGTIGVFTPPTGQAGGDVVNVSSTSAYNFSGIYAGDGGLGARGGNISNVTMNGDDAGGYNIVAGNGGRGTTGGAGGSIINFTDIGSATGQVLIQTGDGGQGTNGLGGNGGTLGLGTATVNVSKGVSEVSNLNINAGLTINLGDGGTGFRGGGNGASLTNLILRSPDTAITYGLAVVGTTHDRAHDPTTGLLIGASVIGNANSFDFDGDGNNDIVYTNALPNELWVAFGNGIGDFFSPISLDGPANIQAVTVADINGDGHPDIIVGSAQAGDFSGLTVFLSKYKNNNGFDQFQGFSSPLISPLPGLDSGDPNSPFTYAFGYRRSSNPITSITAGDFDGDGHTDIALTADYITGGLIGVTGPAGATIEQVLMVMTPDIEDGVSTGHFYADFGTKAGNGQIANAFLPFVTLGTSPNAKIQATALNTTSSFDVVNTLITDGTLVLGSVTGNSSVVPPAGSVPRASLIRMFDFHTKPFGPVELGAIKFEQVDTNRTLTQQTLVTATLKDFAVIDFNSDQNADWIGLSDTPTGYLVGFKGSGVGNGGSFALTNAGSATKDNSGYSLGGSPTAIRGTNPNSLGAMTDVVVLSGGSLVDVDIIENVGVSSNALVGNPGVRGKSTFLGGPTDPKSQQAFDTYLVDPALNFGSTYDIAYVKSFNGFFEASLRTEFDGFQFGLSEHFVQISTGDGGDGQIGKGGNGGVIGGGKLTDTGKRLEGAIDYTLPAVGDLTVEFIGGRGGNGFSLGGTGGAVSNVAVRFNPDATILFGTIALVGGDGGTGNSGAGGAGGGVSNSSTVFGSMFGGNGGDGLTGGSGGSITGHGLKGYADDLSDAVSLLAGSGGNGIRKGGAGGSILNYHGQFNINLIGSSGGLIDYEAGHGGSAAAGPGGAGGDVLNVSAFTGGANSSGDNLLAGDIVMLAGYGGDGTIGGRGGIISGFINQQSRDNPGLLVFIAGNGGEGTKGNGGAGGNVQNLGVSSGGTHRIGTPVVTDFSYNHIVAGAGGDSASATGGVGGSVLNVNTTASDSIYAVSAGAGGNGLLVGGAGGSVKTLALAVGSKGLVIAGSGGSAGAFLGDTPTNPTAFGGAIGRGGAGGSITNFVQTAGTGVHFDLIAGNGGDSLNFGSRKNTEGVKYVGVGGSISNVTVQGDIGNTDHFVAIKSYNDVLGGETMASFVDRVLRSPTDVSLIDDSHGNVGAVVGASGRLNSVFVRYDDLGNAVYRSIPVFSGINGDFVSIRASSIQSAVAGSVDQIAAIRRVINVQPSNATAPFQVGTDKADANGVADPQHPEYRSGEPDGLVLDDKTGLRVIPIVPVLDGRLVDGALVSASLPVNSIFGTDSHVLVTSS
ncbi:MAG TPA: VCBS repeat-containing protein [Chthoniobacteraceae bacterium]|nr:VCBS repeat-containing protein [Chthoniobacteraceae bacterium]